MLAQVKVMDLMRPPMLMSVLEADDLAYNRFVKLFGMTQRSSTLLAHLFQAILDKPIPPFIARLSANPKLSAELREIAVLCRFQYK